MRFPLATLALVVPLAACVLEEPLDEQPVLGEEVAGEPLEQAGFCPELSVSPLALVSDGQLRQLGACGDLLTAGEYERTLYTVEGEVEALAGGAEHQLSPRGRLLSSNDTETVQLRVLASDTPPRSIPIVDNLRYREGFVLSKHGLGAQFWNCDEGALTLRDHIDEAADLVLATEVDCATVVSSPMHSVLAFATLDDEVAWADSDEQLVTMVDSVAFERVDSNDFGDRKDLLELSTTGPYLIHVQVGVTDNDGYPDPLPQQRALHDMAFDRALVENGGVSLNWAQAPVFGAPMYVYSGGLSVVRDGELVTLSTTTFGTFVAARDGSVIARDEDGSIVRYANVDSSEREVLLPAVDAVQAGMWVSPEGRAGALLIETSDCFDAECTTFIRALRQFGANGQGESRWVGLPQVVHVFEDGQVLVHGQRDGEADTSLHLIGTDGATRSSQATEPGLSAGSSVAVADGRLLLALVDQELADELVVVDPAAGDFAPAGVEVPADFDVAWMRVDALGKRVAVRMAGAYGLGGGTIWGELP